MLDFVCHQAADCTPAVRIAQVLTCAFLAVLFLQSGLDKVFNWKGELGWITEHFSKTPFANFVPQLLGVITLFEVASGVVCGVGAVMLALTGAKSVAVVGVTLAAVSLLQLFAGQRVAKDYPGALAIVPYFILCVVGLALLAAS